MSSGQAHPVTWLADALFAGVVVGAIIGWLPVIAGFVGLVFYSIQIWESKTCQGLMLRWKIRRKERLLRRVRLKVQRTRHRLEEAQATLDALDVSTKTQASG